MKWPLRQTLKSCKWKRSSLYKGQSIIFSDDSLFRTHLWNNHLNLVGYFVDDNTFIKITNVSHAAEKFHAYFIIKVREWWSYFSICTNLNNESVDSSDKRKGQKQRYIFIIPIRHWQCQSTSKYMCQYIKKAWFEVFIQIDDIRTNRGSDRGRENAKNVCVAECKKLLTE